LDADSAQNFQKQLKYFCRRGVKRRIAMSLGKVIATLALLLALLGLCLYVNRGCFMQDGVQIYHRVATRPGAGMARGRPSAANPLIFGFSRPLELKAVKVFQADDLLTNKYPAAVWELLSESNSIPLKLIEYGVPIRGLHPKSPEIRPEPLVPGVTYVLVVETRAQKAEHLFTASARPK
jgi:hypothetical protein